MSLGRTEWPEVGEMVVATVSRLESYGAYVKLDEYNDKEALLHISEISSRWVRNIRNHVREGQKVVLQVLRLDASKGQVDLSLRRVNKDDKRKKLEQWKKSRKADMLFKQAASDLKTTPDDLYNEIGKKILEKHNSIYDAFEQSAKHGAAVFTETGVGPSVAEILTKVAVDKIVVKGVTVHGVFEVTSMSSRGVEDLKELFSKLHELGEEDDAVVAITTLGAPKYRIEVTGDEFKKVELTLDKLVKQAELIWKENEGTITFKREKAS